MGLAGVARIAGLAGKAFARGVNGRGMISSAPKFLQTANKLGRFQNSPIGNYAINTAMDAGMGVVWGENPANALGRSAFANIGGTVAQKGFQKVTRSMGIPDMASEVVGQMFVNPAAYTGMEMLGSKIMPGLYGLDSQGNYVGDMPEQPTMSAIPQQQAIDPMSLLSPADQFRIQSDVNFRQQREQQQAMKRAAANAYKQQLELEASGGFIPGLQNLSQLNAQYGLGGFQ